jgi:hypothetical protein
MQKKLFLLKNEGVRQGRGSVTAPVCTEFGHGGYVEGCEICRLVKGAARRVTVKVHPHKQMFRAFKFAMDAVTFSHRSREGNLHMVTIRCMASDTPFVICLAAKSDFPMKFDVWITETRADPMYKNMGYEFCTVILTDEPGEWGLRSNAWREVKQRHQIKVIHTTPETSKELGAAEKTNSTMEHMVKAMLMQMNLPEAYWEACARASEFILQRHPKLISNQLTVGDGDRARPLEVITGGAYDRRQINRELAYFIQPGTLCMVHVPTAKGSQLKPKCRWGVAYGMYREQVVFLCPVTKMTYRSKSWQAMALNGMNFIQFLGLGTQMSTRKQMIRPPPDGGAVVVLSSPTERGPASAEPLVKLHLASNKPRNGGSVTVTDHDGVVMTPCPTTGVMTRNSAEPKIITGDSPAGVPCDIGGQPAQAPARP